MTIFVCLGIFVLTDMFYRNIYLKVKKAGGMKITFQSPPKSLNEKMIFNILRDYKILNCEVLVRDENGRSSCDPRPVACC